MNFFRTLATHVSTAMGHPFAFVIALLTVVVWAAVGPLCNYSDTWQLSINTGTTIVTFLMVFLIQNLQTRDTKAMHLKLDELIWANKAARNKLIDLESLSDAEMDKLQAEFCHMKDEIQEHVERINKVKKSKKQKNRNQ